MCYDANQTYIGDHFTIYAYIKSLYYIYKTNKINNYILIKYTLIRL